MGGSVSLLNWYVIALASEPRIVGSARRAFFLTSVSVISVKLHGNWRATIVNSILTNRESCPLFWACAAIISSSLSLIVGKRFMRWKRIRDITINTVIIFYSLFFISNDTIFCKIDINYCSTSNRELDLIERFFFPLFRLYTVRVQSFAWKHIRRGWNHACNEAWQRETANCVMQYHTRLFD